ncbi:VCBS domain-containing protein [Alsobacter sp. SYSU M60028]|uniref:VCBS domain-containing protein n=1 Tax=Alsobacter ponti TaxID=2962936 RepID=A0ABT1LD67_9HYPH|nr:VCBS domain-containing protein [Alsobacter ponti]MCP8939442.1 VCBS domain-containing protein [Alsobacter ponti]
MGKPTSSDKITWSSTQTTVEGNTLLLAPITGVWTKLQLSGIPVGATLSDGLGHTFTATLGQTSVDITAWSLSTLSLAIVSDTNFKLVASTGSGVSATDSIVVNPFAPELQWGPTSQGLEGQPIAIGDLSVFARALPGDANTIKSVVISGIPLGVTLSDGAGHSFTATNKVKSIDVTAWSLSGLTAKTQSDVNFSLTVTATERDAEGNTASSTATKAVIVAPLAASVNWDAAPSAGVEGSPIALGALSVTLNKLAADTAHTLKALVIDSIPVGAVLADGAGHSFTAAVGLTAANVAGWSLSTLTITPPGPADFTLRVTAIEADAQGDTTSTTATEAVDVRPLAPVLSTVDAAGEAGVAITLDISSALSGLGAQQASVSSLVLAGLPQGATLSDGTHSVTVDGTHPAVDIAGWALGQLTVIAPAAGHWALTLSGAVTDIDGDQASAVAPLTLTATPPADHAPTLVASVPDAVLVEAGVAADGGTVAGVTQSIAHLIKADADTAAIYDTQGWTQNADGSWSKAGLYGVATLDVANDTLTYHLDDRAAATDRLAAGQSVTEAFTVNVSETGGPLTTSADVVFTVTGSNDAPAFTSAVVDAAVFDTAGADVPADLTGVCATSDPEQDAVSLALAAGQSGLGQLGTFTVDATGRWSFVWKAGAVDALAAGATATDNFVVEASDGHGGTATQTFTFRATGANDTPLLSSAPVDLQLTDTAANDWFAQVVGSFAAVDADGQVLSFALAAGQSGVGAFGSLAVDPSGAWLYTPTPGAVDALAAGVVATDNFLIKVDDGQGGVATQAFTVTVTGADDAPVFLGSGLSVVPEKGLFAAHLDAYDPEGAPISYTLGGPDAGLFSIDGNMLVFKTAPDLAVDPTSYAVEVTASDGATATTLPLSINLTPATGGVFTVVDPANSAAAAAAVIAAVLGSQPGVVADPASFQMVAGASSVMTYDGSLTQLGIGPGLLITSGTTPGTSNSQGYFGVDNGMVGDPALDAVVNTVFQTTSFDATTLTFSFNVTDPSVTGLSLNVVFGSDEYPEWVDAFVDIAVVLVNGVNVAYFGGDPTAPLSVIGSNLSAQYFLDNTGNLTTPSFGGEAIPGQPSTLPIEYDGVSRPLTIYAPVHYGMNTIEIGIADTGDHVYDSGLFVSGLKTTTTSVSGVVLDVPCTDGADDVVGTAASESFDARGGDDVVMAGGGNDVVLGGAGDDDLSGGDGNDFVDGGQGGNTLRGDAGDDIIQHANGALDWIDGGDGFDMLRLDETGATAAARIAVTAQTFTLADGTVVAGVEALAFKGGAGNDTVTGGAGADSLDGGQGDDVLTGGGGDDQITGGLGTDTAVYEGIASNYSVTVIGEALYRVTDLRAGATDGSDVLSGIENLSFADGLVALAGQVAAGVTVTGTANDDWISALQAPAGQPLLTDNGDSVSGMDGDDHIQGGAGADRLEGGDGNDFVKGGAGDDWISGGAGHDELTGGGGADRFVFTSLGDSTPTSHDDVLDFSQAEGDRIDLSGLDAIAGSPGSAFTFVATLSGVAGELAAMVSGDGYLVQGDIDGDGKADFVLQVDTHAALTAADFVL